MRGHKSAAQKRREQMVAEGKIPDPAKAPKSPGKVLAGLKGANERHGNLANFPTVRQVREQTVQANVRNAIKPDAVAIARMLADLALGRGEFNGAPLKERRQAAVHVLGMAGVSLQPVDSQREDRPLAEYDAAELQAFIEGGARELERLAFERGTVPVDAETVNEQSSGAANPLKQQPQQPDHHTGARRADALE